MNTTEIKTIDINTLKWFDKTYGNTYFAQKITLNYGMSDCEVFFNPFQYGYSSYEYEAFKFLYAQGFKFIYKQGLDLSDDCYNLQKLGIIVRTSEVYAKKRDLTHISEIY